MTLAVHHFKSTDSFAKAVDAFPSTNLSYKLFPRYLWQKAFEERGLNAPLKYFTDCSVEELNLGMKVLNGELPHFENTVDGGKLYWMAILVHLKIQVSVKWLEKCSLSDMAGLNLIQTTLESSVKQVLELTPIAAAKKQHENLESIRLISENMLVVRYTDKTTYRYFDPKKLKISYIIPHIISPVDHTKSYIFSKEEFSIVIAALNNPSPWIKRILKKGNVVYHFETALPEKDSYKISLHGKRINCLKPWHVKALTTTEQEYTNKKMSFLVNALENNFEVRKVTEGVANIILNTEIQRKIYKLLQKPASSMKTFIEEQNHTLTYKYKRLFFPGIWEGKIAKVLPNSFTMRFTGPQATIDEFNHLLNGL